MSKTIKEERPKVWVLPIVKREIKVSEAVKVCPYGKRSLERWVAEYKRGGEGALEPKSTRPKTHPDETPIHERTVGKILKTEGLVRKYRVRRMKYKYIKVLLKPGELVEIDVKYVPGNIAGHRYFQYKAIDCASR